MFQRQFRCRVGSLPIADIVLQVFAVKAKFTFPFGKHVVANKYNFLGIIAGACLGMFIVVRAQLFSHVYIRTDGRTSTRHHFMLFSEDL